MMMQDEQQINKLLLVVGADRIGEFIQGLQPEEQAAIQAGYNSKTGATPTTSTRASKTFKKALKSFLRRKAQETLRGRW